MDFMRSNFCIRLSARLWHNTMKMIYILISIVIGVVYIEWNLSWRSLPSGDVGTDANGYCIDFF